MKSKKWKAIIIKNLRLRIIRENLRTLLKVAITTEIKRLDHLEDLYRQKRITNKQVPSQWKRELSIYDKKESLMTARDHSILRCAEGSTCKSIEIESLAQELSTLDKDMVWNPLLKHWVCIDCYDFYYKSDSAKKELKYFLKQNDLL